MTTDPSRRTQVRYIALASGSATMAIAPTFLVAGMSVQIGSSLHLGPAHLGLAVSAFFGMTALSSATLGRAVARAGVRSGLAVVMAVNCIVMLAIAGSQSTIQLATALAIAGAANGAVHPAANTLLASGASGHLGLGLGIKQSSLPAATFAGGLAVPIFALTVGWRWAFVFASLLSLAMLFASLRVPRIVGRAAASAPVGEPAIDPPRLLLLTVAAGFGSAAGASLGVFLVDGAVRGVGMEPGIAGLLAAAAGGAAIALRILLGVLADRKIGLAPYPASVVLLLVGACGFCVMSLNTSAFFVVGALLAMGLGFAWTGLIHFAVVSASTRDAAKATGRLMTGVASGSFAGPIALGQVVKHWGYPSMWLAMGGLSLLSAYMVWRVHVRANRSRP